MSVIAPAGNSVKGALPFISLNYWTFMPQATLTYFAPVSGWNVSGAVLGSNEASVWALGPALSFPLLWVERRYALGRGLLCFRFKIQVM